MDRSRSLRLGRYTARRDSVGAAGGEALPSEFWSSLVWYANKMGVSPYDLAWVMNSESGLNPAAWNKPGNHDSAKGLNQLMPFVAKTLGMSGDEWLVYQDESAVDQLAWVTKYFMSRPGGVSGNDAVELYAKNFGDNRNPNGSLYDRDAKAKGYANADSQRRAYDANKGMDITREDGSVRALGETPKGYFTRADLLAFLNRSKLKSWASTAIANAGGGAPPPPPKPYVKAKSGLGGLVVPAIVGIALAAGAIVAVYR